MWLSCLCLRLSLGLIARTEQQGRKETPSFLFSQNTNGILAMLDEECLRPGTVTDETFLEKLNQVCATHQHFESRMSKCSRFLNDTTLPHSCFRIQHYAGKVLGSSPAPGHTVVPRAAVASGRWVCGTLWPHEVRKSNPHSLTDESVPC